MRRYTPLVTSLFLIAAYAATADAQTKYWDIDTVSQTGAGGATPSGTWNTANTNWNSNATGTGVPTTWTSGNTAVFAAGADAIGAYTVTVSGTQTLAGLTVEEGTISQSGGTLNFGSAANIPISIASGATWNENSAGVFAGTGGLIKSGTGTLTLRGTNTFSRVGTGNRAFLRIDEGVVDFTSDANLGAVPSATDNGSALMLNGGTLRLSGSSPVTLAVRRGFNVAAPGGTVEVTNATTLLLPFNAPASAAFTGSGTLTKTGFGRFLPQTSQTTFTGKYIVKGGSVAFQGDSGSAVGTPLGAVPASPQADYFTLDGGGIASATQVALNTLNANRGITLGSNGGYLAGPGVGLAYDGVIAGNQGGGLRIQLNDAVGTGTSGFVSLGGLNTYDGPTQIDLLTTLSVTQLANGGSPSGIGQSSNAASNLILNGGSLRYLGMATANTDRNFTLPITGGYIEASSTTNQPLNFTSTAPIVLTGTGPRVLVLRGTSTANNTMSLSIGDQGANATTLDKLDAGTWVLTNTANSYTGNTVLGTLGGTLKVGASGAIPDASIVQLFASTVFDLNGFDETVKSISGASATIALSTKALTLINPNGETYSGAITGAGGGKVIKNGTGKITLTPSSSTYDGGLTLNAGGLGLGNTAALGTGRLTVNNSATLANATTSALARTNAVTLNGNLTVDDSFVSSPGAITWGTSGANQWTITGGNRTVTVNRASVGYQMTINQVIGQDAPGRGLTKAGNGTLTLGAANTYTGDTRVQAGTLSIASAYLAETADVYLTTGAKFNLGFSGINNIDSLFIDGVSKAAGTWGSTTSAATNKSPLFTGPGQLMIMTFIAPLLGDFNSDGKVDAADYVTWRKAENSMVPLPNDNNLGTPIGTAHYALWRANFGNPPGSGSGANLADTSAVPEPTAALLFLTGFAALTRRRRRKHNC